MLMKCSLMMGYNVMLIVFVVLVARYAGYCCYPSNFFFFFYPPADGEKSNTCSCMKSIFNALLSFYKIIPTTSAVSSAHLGSILIFASCVICRSYIRFVILFHYSIITVKSINSIKCE